MMVNQRGPVTINNEDAMQEFDLTISYGLENISLNDHVNYQVAADEFGNKQTSLRRIEAESPYYDGTFTIHVTKGNIMEPLSLYVRGATQNQVTENLLFLEELFMQPTYTMTLRMDDHLETWKCWPAEYSIERSHVFMHAGMAVFKVQVPRHPTVSYEVIL